LAPAAEWMPRAKLHHQNALTPLRLILYANSAGSQFSTRPARRIRRLPGLPSSNICLESMTGDLDDFSIESYLGSPAEREVPGVDMHSQVPHQVQTRFCISPLMMNPSWACGGTAMHVLKPLPCARRWRRSSA